MSQETAEEHSGESDPALRTVPFLAVDERVLALMSAVLEAASIPRAILDEGFRGMPALVVPAPFAANAARVLASIDRLVPMEQTLVPPGRTLAEGESTSDAAGGEEAVLPCFRFYDPDQDEEIRNEPLVSTDLSDAAALSPEQLDRLRDCVVRGTRQIAERALLLLERGGEASLHRLVEALERIMDIGSIGKARLVCQCLQRAGEHERAWQRTRGRIEEVLRSGMEEEADFERIQTAIQVAGLLRFESVAPLLIALLEAPQEEIAEEADETLIELSDEDLGFEPDLDEDEKRGVIEARWAWWRERCGDSP